MRFVILFVLASCGTKLPPVPQHYQSTFIDDYVYSIPYYDNLPEKRSTVRSLLDKKPVCVTLDDYSKLKKYAGDVLQIIRNKCPALVK